MLIKYQNLSGSQYNQFMEVISTLDDENMWSNGWASKPHTLPYLLFKSDRFTSDKGEFHIRFIDNQIAACGGVYLSQFDPTFALAGTRTWVHKDFRNQLLVRDLLAEHKKWAIEHGCGAVGICFNNYNKNLISVFKRTRLGEQKDRISERASHHLFYTGLIEVPFAVTVQHTKQWVLYEQLDPQWSFDWNSIREG